MCPARLLDFLALPHCGGLKKIPPWAVWGWYISIKLSTTAEMPGKGVKGETRAAGTA